MSKRPLLGPIRPPFVRSNPGDVEVFGGNIKGSVIDAKKLVRRLGMLIKDRVSANVPDILDYIAHIAAQAVVARKDFLIWAQDGELRPSQRDRLQDAWFSLQQLQRTAGKTRKSIGLFSLKSRINWDFASALADNIGSHVSDAEKFIKTGDYDVASRRLLNMDDSVVALVEALGFEGSAKDLYETLGNLKW